MRLRFRYILILPIFWLFVSCEQEIPVDLAPITPKLVLNGVFAPDSTWEVYLSHSLSIADTGLINPVEDAVVIIRSEDAIHKETLIPIGDGYYSSPKYTPEPKEVYSISVEAPGYEPISARSQVPDQIRASLGDTVTGSYLNKEVLNISIDIEDNELEENYYLIEMKLIAIEERSAGERSNRPIYTHDKNAENGQLDLEGQGFERIYLPDKTFNGQSYTTSISTDKDLLDNPDMTFTLEVHVRSVNRDLYLHLMSYEKYLQSALNPAQTQPVQIYSNVMNGFGIFAGYTEKVLLIRL